MAKSFSGKIALSASSASSDYADRGTFAFTGRTIDSVVVDVTGDKCIDHEAQVRAWLLTDQSPEEEMVPDGHRDTGATRSLVDRHRRVHRVRCDATTVAEAPTWVLRRRGPRL
jgi:hypothetical protein